MDFGTFFIYTFIMFFCVGAGFLLTATPRTVTINGHITQNRNFYIIIYTLVTIYTLIVGLRYEVGADYLNYLEWFKVYCHTNIYPVEGQDGLFLFLNYITKELGLHYSFIFIVLAFLLIVCLVRGLFNIRFLYAYYFFFFFTIIFNESMNVMRQIAAFYMWFCAYSLWFEKKKRGAVFFALMGVLMHKSSLLALSWSLFFKIDLFKKKEYSYLLLVLSFLLGVFLYDYFKLIFEFLALNMGDRYAMYANQWHMEQFEMYTEEHAGEGIAVMAYLIIDLLIVKSSKRLRKQYANFNFSFYYNLFLIGEILNSITSANTIFVRVNYYFILHKIIILSFFCHYAFSCKNNRKWHQFCGIIIIAIYLVLHYRHILHNPHINPYRMVL